MKKFTSSLLLGAALCAWTAAGAQSFSAVQCAPVQGPNRVAADYDFPDNATPFRYYSSVGTSRIGTGQAATLRAAIYVPSSMAGAKICGLTVEGVNNSGITQLDGWTKTSLSGESTANVVASWDGDMIVATFDEPVDVPGAGMYVGYTLASNQTYPIPFGPALNPAEAHNAAYLAIGASGSFADYADSGWGVLTITAYLTDVPGENAVALTSFKGGDFVGQNEPFTVTVGVSNSTATAVQTVDYEYTINGETVQGSADVNLAAQINAAATFDVTMAPLPEKQAYPITFTITKVDGQDNTSGAKTYTGNVNVIAFVPVNHPLLEEGTGTWCGWCPRGWIGMEKMNELYPDFVGVAWHNGDPMEITASSNFPFDFGGGFPGAAINRSINGIDPYYGTGNDDFGIYDTYAQAAEAFAVADLDVTAEWAADSLHLNLTTEAHFAATVQGYKLGYLLCEDGYDHNTTAWKQTNNYAGKSGYEGTYLQELTTWPSKVAIIFNDVVIANVAAKGVANSLPATAETEQTYTHTYSFVTDSSVKSTTGNSLIENRGNIFVVAMLIAPDGTVKNSRKLYANQGTTGVGTVATDGVDTVVSSVYFDLNGRQIANPANGLYIRQDRMADGSLRASKVRF